MSKRSSLGTHDDGDPLTNDAMERLDKVRYEFKEPDEKKKRRRIIAPFMYILMIFVMVIGLIMSLVQIIWK